MDDPEDLDDLLDSEFSQQIDFSSFTRYNLMPESVTYNSKLVHEVLVSALTACGL